MFRIATTTFDRVYEDVSVKKMVVECATENIKRGVALYFNSDIKKYWQYTDEISLEKIVSLINVEALKEDGIIKETMVEEMSLIGIDGVDFISKKVAKLWIDLLSEEEITPDVFTEYLLSEMMRAELNREEWRIKKDSQIEMKELEIIDEVEYYLKHIAVEENDVIIEELNAGKIDKNEEINIYELTDEELESIPTSIDYYMYKLTTFPYMLDLQDDESEDNPIFWDYDYSIFETSGFLKGILLFVYEKDVPTAFEYGYKELERLFKSVGYEIPIRDNVIKAIES